MYEGVASDFDLDIKEFNSAYDFWEFITKKDKWYLKYSPYRIKNIDTRISELEPLIIDETNRLREIMKFTNDEYRKIIDWDNFLIRADLNKSNKFKLNKSIEFKQYCPSCGNEREFTQRYPKCICRKCYNKVMDLNGRKVEFFNTNPLGYGCQGYYVGTEQVEKYDSNLCFINGKEYFAEEARFGGIVIQLKE